MCSTRASCVLVAARRNLNGWHPAQANYAAAKLGIVAMSRHIAGEMQRYNVRSDCFSPFAWSRMVGAVHTDTPE